MPTLKAFVVNQSEHMFQTVGCWGTPLTCEQSIAIPPKATVQIGKIETPLGIGQGWGWWYIQDRLNRAILECYAGLEDSPQHNEADIGLMSNADHCKDRPEGSTPRRVPQYAQAACDGHSFIYTIQSAWTETPPDYVFNYGHYCCFIPHAPGHELAAHAYLIARSFNGEERIDFNCYGNVTPDYHPDEWVDVAGTYLGTKDQLRLARVICCFDPEDRRDVYNLRPFRNDNTFKPVGKLGLGDCSGIIFGISGVCQHMANRIAAAVTDLDAGVMAAMPAYNLAHFIWGTYGSIPLVNGSDPYQLKPLAQRIFADVYPSKLDKLSIERIQEAPYPMNLLVRPWEAYLAECKRVAFLT